MTTVAIVQSNYIPWRGYFDIIRKSDIFITLDVVQYTRRDWRNRNIIKTSSGPQWLTIPVQVKGRYDQPIDNTAIDGGEWTEKHIQAISLNYRRAAAFNEIAPSLFGALRKSGAEKFLSPCNEHLLNTLCGLLGISTPICRAADLLPRSELLAMEATARLVQLCKAAGADCYLSGPAARDYLDVAAFESEGIAVAWMDYGGYPEYPQLWGEFSPAVSAIDLLLNCGAMAKDYLGAT
jgi:hypothetical protein